MGGENFKNLLISIPKCIELDSKSIPFDFCSKLRSLSMEYKSINVIYIYQKSLIRTNSNLYRINESKGIIENTNINLNTTTKYNFKFPLQSEMSGLLAEEILLKSFCNLTPYHISSKLHKQLLNNFIQYFPIEVTKNGKLCPIT